MASCISIRLRKDLPVALTSTLKLQLARNERQIALGSALATVAAVGLAQRFVLRAADMAVRNKNQRHNAGGGFGAITWVRMHIQCGLEMKCILYLIVLMEFLIFMCRI